MDLIVCWKVLFQTIDTSLQGCGQRASMGTLHADCERDASTCMPENKGLVYLQT
jgi:hypothetical protein